MSQIKLSIKIDNSDPIELNGLTNSLNAFAKEYDDYCKKEFDDLTKNDRKLQIVKLEQGSLLIELVPVVVPLIQEVNAVFCFGKHIIDVIDFFTGNNEENKLPHNFSKKNCDNMHAFLEQTASDNGANCTVSVIGNNNTIICGKTIGSLESSAAQNNISKHRDMLLEEEPIVKNKQAFYWETASFVKGSSGQRDRGIIESVDKRAKRIIFKDEVDKEVITTSSNKYTKEWQDLIYIVDVEIIKVQDTIKSYKILKVYENDTIEE